ncbi:hypothetical protein [Streptomyces sp. NPDC058735]
MTVAAGVLHVTWYDDATTRIAFAKGMEVTCDDGLHEKITRYSSCAAG